MRCEPKLIEGTEIVRAFPRPSSRETLNDCCVESSGRTSNSPTGSRPLITVARWLLKSSATSDRLTLNVRSFLIVCGRLSGDDANNGGAGFGSCFGSTVCTDCGGAGVVLC
jgi:hypothetical protein